MKAPFPSNENQRILKLLSYNILDTAAETAYDDLTLIAAHICETPIALVSLVDRDRQWFKAKVGLDAPEMNRDQAFCAHAILQPDTALIVPDTHQDRRFADNPLVTDRPNLRFYAGTPLVTPDGYAIGTLCVVDYRPRTLSSQQIAALEALGRQVVSQLELRLNVVALRREVSDRQQAEAEVQRLNAALEERVRQRTAELQQTLEELQQTQAQLMHSEKIASLGQLVAGVAHEINNPVNFIAGNLRYACQHAQDLLGLVHTYQQEYPAATAAIQKKAEAIDLQYLCSDLPKLLASMKLGTDRIRDIVALLRTFSRVDSAIKQPADLHAGLESTLMILRHRLIARRPEIEVVCEYGDLPPVTCYAGQLNQVFMNLLANAIDALEDAISAKQPSKDPPTIRIRTQTETEQWVKITIADNGPGMNLATQQKLFQPFFTTKPAGRGTGLGLSISHQIITQTHQGELHCRSTAGRGTEFTIRLPILPVEAPAPASASVHSSQLVC